MRFSFGFSNILGAIYHKGSITFGPDGNSLFSPVGNKIVVYDLKSNKSGALPLQVHYNFNLLAIHPSSTILLASSEKNHLYIVSLVSGKQLHMKEYRHIGSRITHLSFSSSGQFYCVCGDNRALVYMTPGSLVAGKGREVTPFRIYRNFTVHNDIITYVSWSKDDNYMAIGSNNMSVTVFDIRNSRNGFVHLKGHSDTIASCYFANQYLQDRSLYSISRNGQLFVWQEKEKNEIDHDNESEIAHDDPPRKKISRNIMKYYRAAKHYLEPESNQDETKEEKKLRFTSTITATAYNEKAQLLVVGYNHGQYLLFELPSATLMHSMRIDTGAIETISINPTGDWIAIASSVDPSCIDKESSRNNTQSRLLVWEWQSKSNILDQFGSGGGSSNLHECVSYSLDGTHVVSGSTDGKIRVWNTLTGESVASFGDEHRGPIKAIKFAPNKSGKVIISASLDGTVRAFDLTKFKNFRTLTSPNEERKPEFICLDVDNTGDFIAAGTYNYFEIYLWSLQTGKFMEHLSGHTGPVSGLAFSPTTNTLVSCSWDCSIKIWSLFEGNKSSRETITISSEAIAIAFRPDGYQFAVSSATGNILFYDPRNGEQFGVPIEGSNDLGMTQLMNEVSRDKDKYFTTIQYSADGSHIIAAGRSNHICIYNVNEKILIKKFSITFNMSMDGIFDYVSSRKKKEFGFNLEMIKYRNEKTSIKPIELPGVRKGDLGDRNVCPVMVVNQIQFSPTMRSFVTVTTEGVLIYSLDTTKNFDPYKLSSGVDPESIRRALQQGRLGAALIESLQLNDTILLTEVIEAIPSGDIETIVSNLDLDYTKKLLAFLSRSLTSTKHLEFYLLWVRHTLYKHGVSLKNLKSLDVTPIVRSLHQNLFRLHEDIRKNCDYSKYSIRFITRGMREYTIEDEAM